jgi:hypothetical protein
VATSEAGIRASPCLISLTGAPVAVGFIAQVGDRIGQLGQQRHHQHTDDAGQRWQVDPREHRRVAWPLTELVTCRPSNHVDSCRRGTPLTRSW